MEPSNTEKGFDRAELWRVLITLIQSEQDQIVLLESFVYGLAPQAILERHGDRFDDIAAIYRTKRRLLDRIERILPGEN